MIHFNTHTTLEFDYGTYANDGKGINQFKVYKGIKLDIKFIVNFDINEPFKCSSIIVNYNGHKEVMVVKSKYLLLEALTLQETYSIIGWDSISSIQKLEYQQKCSTLFDCLKFNEYLE